MFVGARVQRGQVLDKLFRSLLQSSMLLIKRGEVALKNGMHVVKDIAFSQNLRHAKDAGTDLINRLLTGGSNVRGGVPPGRHHQPPQWQRRHIKQVSKMLIVSALPDLPRVSSEMMEQL